MDERGVTVSGVDRWDCARRLGLYDNAPEISVTKVGNGWLIKAEVQIGSFNHSHKYCDEQIVKFWPEVASVVEEIVIRSGYVDRAVDLGWNRQGACFDLPIWEQAKKWLAENCMSQQPESAQTVLDVMESVRKASGK